MAIYKGNKKVVAVYKGSTPINKIYKGSTLVFQKNGGGGSTHLIEGTATGNFNININGQSIPIAPDADGKWFYDTNETITSLNSAFYGVTAITSVDLSNLDLTGISASAMFDSCSNITSIKFNNTKSMKLTSLSSMFSGCNLLTSLDLSSFDTSDVKNVISSFDDCSSLVSLDLSNFDMSNVTNLCYNMFKNCTSLSTIKCKQAFKDWCNLNKYSIQMQNVYETINWEIVG